MSLFKGAQRKITVENLAKKYNAIIHAVESDESLLICIDGESLSAYERRIEDIGQSVFHCFVLPFMRCKVVTVSSGI